LTLRHLFNSARDADSRTTDSISVSFTHSLLRISHSSVNHYEKRCTIIKLRNKKWNKNHANSALKIVPSSSFQLYSRCRLFGQLIAADSISAAICQLHTHSVMHITQLRQPLRETIYDKLRGLVSHGHCTTKQNKNGIKILRHFLHISIHSSAAKSYLYYNI
jgi:hypothetical protein